MMEWLASKQRGPKGPLSGREEVMLYRFEKDGFQYYAEANNAWEARVDVEASCHVNLQGAKIYRCPNCKTEQYAGIVK